jgi:hypothetical protein
VPSVGAAGLLGPEDAHYRGAPNPSRPYSKNVPFLMWEFGIVAATQAGGSDGGGRFGGHWPRAWAWPGRGWRRVRGSNGPRLRPRRSAPNTNSHASSAIGKKKIVTRGIVVNLRFRHLAIYLRCDNWDFVGVYIWSHFSSMSVGSGSRPSTHESQIGVAVESEEIHQELVVVFWSSINWC